MTKSDSINELATALCKAQAAFEGAKKDSNNPFFNSKYADLEAVWSAARKPLTENGLSVTQLTSVIDGRLYIETMLMHNSGQFISGSIPVLAKDNSAQAMGSAISYARRYALSAIIGGYAIDDDGNEASKTEAHKHIVNHAPKISDKMTALYQRAHDAFGLRKLDVDQIAMDRFKKVPSELTDLQINELITLIKESKK